MYPINTIPLYFMIIGALCATWCYTMPKETLLLPNNIHNTSVIHAPRIHFIMDLGGVCFETAGKVMAQKLGFMNLLRGISSGIPPKTIKKKLYHVLHTIQPMDEALLMHASRDPDGDIMPSLMGDWMSGTPNKDILEKINESVALNPNWFVSNIEKKLVLRLAKAMFIPKAFVESRYLVQEAHEFVTYCKQKGYRMSVLSNWDKESFEYLFNKYYSFFQKFDSIAISGETGALKPSLDAYEPFLTAYPEDCFIFIDDQIENIEAARKMGMYTIHVPSQKNMLGTGTPDFSYVYNQMSAITAEIHTSHLATRTACQQHTTIN